MIKNRHTVSSFKVSKRSLRPSSSTHPSKPNKLSEPVNRIICSLQRNVKDLKTYYNNRQQPRSQTTAMPKTTSSLRLNRVLRRDSSQTHLKPESRKKAKESQPQGDQSDKALADVFEIRRSYQRATGRQSNSIIELYQFYKKNVQKRQKSTRILASIDMSNPNTALSLDVGKESLLKNQLINHRDYRQLIKEEQSVCNHRMTASGRYDISSKLQNTSNLHKSIKNQQRPSNLASDLLRKGLYDMSNVANLMINKKYKLTKEKEESFQMAKERKQHLKSMRQSDTKENNINLQNAWKKPSEISQQKCVQEEKNIHELKSSEKSKMDKMDKQFSFDIPCLNNGNPSPFAKSIKSSLKSQNSSEIKQFQMSSIKKVEPNQVNNEASALQESPIISKKPSDFAQSKYYVQPIPSLMKKQQPKSISLECNSRLIDTDLLPFNL